MPSLPETQRLFGAALSGEAPAVDAVLALLAPTAGGENAKRRRFEAYRRNVIGNWVNALRATYPVVERLVGAAFFDEAARRYALAHASVSGDLNDYGESFANFLARYPHAAPLPYLADLARLEWALQASYYAADCAPFDVAALAAIPAEEHGGLRFALAPAFRRRRSEFPLAAIWQAHQGETVTPVEFTAGPHAAWIVRPRGRVWVEPASAGDDAFVGALGNGARLDAAIALGLAADSEFAVGACLVRLVQLGVIAGFIAPGENS